MIGMTKMAIMRYIDVIKILMKQSLLLSNIVIEMNQWEITISGMMFWYFRCLKKDLNRFMKIIEINLGI